MATLMQTPASVLPEFLRSTLGDLLSSSARQLLIRLGLQGGPVSLTAPLPAELLPFTAHEGALVVLSVRGQRLYREIMGSVLLNG